MSRYEFCLTKDGSIGLYNNEVQDIYHSSRGALQEAIQKFILPSGLLNFAETNDKINILDICYGIGYNSKSALYLSKKKNKNIKIKIDALEIDEELVYISPFIKDTIPSIDLKLFLIKQLMNNSLNFNDATIKILNNISKDLTQFYNPSISNSFKNYVSRGYNDCHMPQKEPFLHNIYYQYISNSMKSGLLDTIYSDCEFMHYSDDARITLSNLDNSYDFILLDAFTPQKDPTLWTLEFLKLIKQKMSKNSILITYSNSTPFRAALLNLNFHVGKVLINEKQFGTVASLNKEKIAYPLDEYDIGLTKTTAGIIYRDKNLNLPRKEIIINRETEKLNSDRISTSKYKKGK